MLEMSLPIYIELVRAKQIKPAKDLFFQSHKLALLCFYVARPMRAHIYLFSAKQKQTALLLKFCARVISGCHIQLSLCGIQVIVCSIVIDPMF